MWFRVNRLRNSSECFRIESVILGVSHSSMSVSNTLFFLRLSCSSTYTRRPMFCRRYDDRWIARAGGPPPARLWAGLRLSSCYPPPHLMVFGGSHDSPWLSQMPDYLGGPSPMLPRPRARGAPPLFLASSTRSLNVVLGGAVRAPAAVERLYRWPCVACYPPTASWVHRW